MSGDWDDWDDYVFYDNILKPSVKKLFPICVNWPDTKILEELRDNSEEEDEHSIPELEIVDEWDYEWLPTPEVEVDELPPEVLEQLIHDAGYPEVEECEGCIECAWWRAYNEGEEELEEIDVDVELEEIDVDVELLDIEDFVGMCLICDAVIGNDMVFCDACGFRVED